MPRRLSGTAPPASLSSPPLPRSVLLTLHLGPGFASLNINLHLASMSYPLYVLCAHSGARRGSVGVRLSHISSMSVTPAKR